ncbi:MAG: DUF4271 domain-containing protein [Saprospiraceae bacterium]|nr:DUF4271 domain-containing protein [Saprospiraceae bacterium]
MYSLGTIVAQKTDSIPRNPFELVRSTQSESPKVQKTSEEETSTLPSTIFNNKNADEQDNAAPSSGNDQNNAGAGLTNGSFKGNPFEVIAVDHSKVNETTTSKPSTSKQHLFSNFKPDITPIFQNSSGDTGFKFWIILACMLFLTAVATLNRGIFVNIYQAFRSDNMLRMWYRERVGRIFDLYFSVLYLISNLTIALFIFMILRFYYFKHIGIKAYIFILVTLIALFLLKQLVLAIISAVYPVEKEISLYQFMLNIFNVALGLLLIPIVILQAFAQADIAFWASALGVAIFIIMYGYTFLRGFLIAARYLQSQILHFLLYLCTVEIVPLLVILKYCPFIINF